MMPQCVLINGKEIDLTQTKQEIKSQLGFEFNISKTVNIDPTYKLALFPDKKYNGWVRHYFSLCGNKEAVLYNGISDLMDNKEAEKLIGDCLSGYLGDDKHCIKAFVGLEEIDYSKFRFDGISERDENRIPAIEQGIDKYCQSKADEMGIDYYTVIRHGLSSIGCVFNSVSVYRKQVSVFSFFKK